MISKISPDTQENNQQVKTTYNNFNKLLIK